MTSFHQPAASSLTTTCTCRLQHDCIKLPCVCPSAGHARRGAELDQVYRDHIERQWELLTVAGASAKEHAQQFAVAEASGKSGLYQLPFKPWVKTLAGQQLVFRGRTPGAAPHLHAELLFISDIMHLLQPPALEGDRVLFNETHDELLAELQEQCPPGPWGELLSAQVQVRRWCSKAGCWCSMAGEVGSWYSKAGAGAGWRIPGAVVIRASDQSCSRRSMWKRRVRVAEPHVAPLTRPNAFV